MHGQIEKEREREREKTKCRITIATNHAHSHRAHGACLMGNVEFCCSDTFPIMQICCNRQLLLSMRYASKNRFQLSSRRIINGSHVPKERKKERKKKTGGGGWGEGRRALIQSSTEERSLRGPPMDRPKSSLSIHDCGGAVLVARGKQRATAWQSFPHDARQWGGEGCPGTIPPFCLFFFSRKAAPPSL